MNNISSYKFMISNNWILGVGEWVNDCCLTPTQLYHGENKLIFNVMMRSTLY